MSQTSSRIRNRHRSRRAQHDEQLHAERDVDDQQATGQSPRRNHGAGWHEITMAAGAAQPVERKARLPQFIGLQEGRLVELDELRLLLVGAGSVNGRVALHAARLQPKEIAICDSGKIKAESLLTHDCLPGDIDSKKATHYGRHSKVISSTTRVLVHDGPVQELALSDFADSDLVMLATDNLAAELDVAQRCMWLGKPLFIAAVHGETLYARVQFWANRSGAGACPVCGFGQEEMSHLNGHTIWKCSGPESRIPGSTAIMPTMSVSFLCSIAADLMLTQMLKWVLGLGRPLEDSILEYCGYTHKVTTAPLRRRPDCPVEHIVYSRQTSAVPLGHRSLQDLAVDAGFGASDAHPDLSFVVDELVFVESAMCCGHVQAIRRFAAPGQQVARCPICRSSIRVEPQSFYCHRPVASAILNSLVEQPLAELGAEACRYVVVRSGGAGVFFA